MRKTFVLDTSVIIHDPHAIHQFGEHDVIIPLAVISEMDGFKIRNDQKGYNAREFSRILDGLKEAHDTLIQPVPLPEPSTGTIMVSPAGETIRELPSEIEGTGKDRQIIATALRWHRKLKDSTVVLVSKDTNVRLLGHACGLITEDYKRGQIKDVTLLHEEPVKFAVDDLLIDRLMKEQTIPVSEIAGLEEAPVNSCYTFTGLIDSGKSALAIAEPGAGFLQFRRLLRDENRMWGLSPRNREQIFASALLLNPDIRLVSLIGKAGTGKTLLALAAALEQTYSVPSGRYSKIVVMRPVVPVGKDMGWLPGDINEKIAPWMKPIYDNIGFLMRDENHSASENGKEQSGRKTRTQQLMEDGILEVEVLSFVRGRSINDAFIIIDEAQNLTPHEIKTLITRAAGRSKVVLTGDLGQIDTPYLDAGSSGLTHVVKKFHNHPIFGYVVLQKGERSELAELAADFL